MPPAHPVRAFGFCALALAAIACGSSSAPPSGADDGTGRALERDAATDVGSAQLDGAGEAFVVDPPSLRDARAVADATAWDSAGAEASDGWHLVWSDEFDGAAGAAVDRSKWAFDLGGGGWGNGELETYTDRAANVALDGVGRLRITASREGAGFTSARLTTQRLASWTYGRFEARVQVPAGPGLWPAFWLLGDNLATAGWPACGEIDVMENIGREPAIVHGTIHGPGYSAAAGPTAAYTLASGLLADDFRIFAVEWEMNAIRWYLDGRLYATKTLADIPPGAGWVFAHPFFMILNLAIGGAWPGPPDATTTFPQNMLVDYVRVYQR